MKNFLRDETGLELSEYAVAPRAWRCSRRSFSFLVEIRHQLTSWRPR